MRYLDYDDVLGYVSATLRDVVLPEVPAGAARQQLWAAIGILNNLGSRLSDLEARTETELACLEALLEACPQWISDLAETDDRVDDGGTDRLEMRNRMRALLAGALMHLAEGRDMDEASRRWLAACEKTLYEIEASEMEAMRPTHYFQAIKDE